MHFKIYMVFWISTLWALSGRSCLQTGRLSTLPRLHVQLWQYLLNLIHQLQMYLAHFFSASCFKRICPAVTNAETNHSLNLSTILMYMLFVTHICSSTRSKAACAMNWFKCRWSSFCGHKNNEMSNLILSMLWYNSMMPAFLNENALQTPRCHNVGYVYQISVPDFKWTDGQMGPRTLPVLLMPANAV